MKAKYILTAILLFSLSVSAQVSTNLNFLQTAPASRLSEWPLRKDIFLYRVQVQGAAGGLNVKIRVEIKDEGGAVIATTNLAAVPAIRLNPGANLFGPAEIFLLQYISFSGRAKTSVEKTGSLPSGNYQFCVRLFTATDLAPIGEELCRPFSVTAYQLPILMQPAAGAVIDATAAQTNITFRWTPLVPRPPLPVTYRLQVFEVLDKQTPMQAFRSNQPLLDKNVAAVNQFLWMPQLDFSVPRKFIWTIQALDANGIPYASNSADGRAEPLVFEVKKGR